MAKKKQFAKLAEQVEELAKQLYELCEETDRDHIGRTSHVEKYTKLFEEIKTFFNGKLLKKVATYFEKHPEHPYKILVIKSCEHILGQVREVEHLSITADIDAICSRLSYGAISHLQGMLYSLAISTDQVKTNLLKI